jgi:hypothetical protein
LSLVFQILRTKQEHYSFTLCQLLL